MKSVKNNLSPTENPVSNTFGYLFSFIGFALYMVPKFYDMKNPVEWYMPFIFMFLGLACIFAKDDVGGMFKSLINTLKSFVSRKAKTV